MRDFLTALIECSVSMSALALALIALTPLLSKRYASRWLYYAWLVVVAGLIVPFRPHFPTAWIPADAVSPAIQRVLPGNAGTAAVQMVVESQGFPAIPWVQIAGILWLAGAAAFLLYHGLRHARFIRMAKRWGEPADDPRTLEVLGNIKNDLGIGKRVGLRICSCVSSPMMTGFLSPVILLPRSDFPADELPYILRHELVHFKRKDLWFKSLVVLATAIHWFNPVVYLMAKAVALQCEISCDAQVVDGIGPESRQRYGEAIIGAIQRQPDVRTAFSTNFYGGKKGMKKRIFSIMDTQKKKVGIAVLCLILIGTLGTGAALAANNKAEAPAAGKREESVPASSRTDALEQIRTVAGKWAEAVKMRDGKAQYDLLSPECQSAVYDEYNANHWSTGTSSPWVESYEISVDQDSATITYRYAASTGFAGAYEQTLSFVQQDGKYSIDDFYLIDAFSEPKLIESTQAGSGNVSYDPKVKAFLNSSDGISFQKTANRFVKAYLIGDTGTMKNCLSNPESGQNDFSMNGKTVNWKSLTLKLDPEKVGEDSVSAEYEIALTGQDSFDYLYLNMEKANSEWKVNSYGLEK